MRLARYLGVMAVFMLAVAGLAVWLIVRLESAFRANPVLNAVLIAVWLIGVVYIFAQTLRLGPEIRWLRAVQRNRLAVNELDPPPLMSSLARLMEDRRAPLALSPPALRAVLDGIAVRLDEGRETARYFVGLLIFLGLLGTFWGLLKTVGSVGGVVNGLSATADPTELFATLKAGLQGPLEGMATAFGSSLLGLAGSLVLGFLDLQLGHAQNRFFVDLEDWLFAASRGGETGLAEQASSETMLRILIQQTAVNIDSFRRVVTDAEDGGRRSTEAIQTLTEHIGHLADRQDSGRRAIEHAAAMAEATGRILSRVEQLLATSVLNDHGAVTGHLRAIESALSRIADDQAEARARTRDEMRNELGRLARTLGAETDGKIGS